MSVPIRLCKSDHRRKVPVAPEQSLCLGLNGVKALPLSIMGVKDAIVLLHRFEASLPSSPEQCRNVAVLIRFPRRLVNSVT
jgi:hypothetical protein